MPIYHFPPESSTARAVWDFLHIPGSLHPHFIKGKLLEPWNTATGATKWLELFVVPRSSHRIRKPSSIVSYNYECFQLAQYIIMEATGAIPNTHLTTGNRAAQEISRRGRTLVLCFDGTAGQYDNEVGPLLHHLFAVVEADECIASRIRTSSSCSGYSQRTRMNNYATTSLELGHGSSLASFPHY